MQNPTPIKSSRPRRLGLPGMYFLFAASFLSSTPIPTAITLHIYCCKTYVEAAPKLCALDGSHHDTILLVFLLVFPAQLAILRHSFLLLPTVPLQFFKSLDRLGEFICCSEISSRTSRSIRPREGQGHLQADLEYHFLASSILCGHPIPFSVK